ncbi:MAG: DUF4242 domain-containing protein [Cyclobacteriaceae bacterium]|nr:DUF4242 domain-containing protein [Cyclobacteriaceae bacterium]
MPIYMDRHDVSADVTAENVAMLHQQDLKIQHKFHCQGLTYWFDGARKTAFCLIEAPDEQAIIEMHNHAHGEVPHRVIEVDPTIVESFLGRIEDPENVNNSHLNVIDDPAFRVIMIAELNSTSLCVKEMMEFTSGDEKYKFYHEEIKRFEGSLVSQKGIQLLISFKKASQAVHCAQAMQSKHPGLNGNSSTKNTELKIAICGGVPVTDEKRLFEKAIRIVKNMSEISKAKIIASTEVKDLCERENCYFSDLATPVHVVTASEDSFLEALMMFIEQNLGNENLSVGDFNAHLGYSKSRLYRKMVDLTGKSPNVFLKDYRLKWALSLLENGDRTISEVSCDAGFGSLAYFSTCFQKKYELSPSEFKKRIE